MFATKACHDTTKPNTINPVSVCMINIFVHKTYNEVHVHTVFSICSLPWLVVSLVQIRCIASVMIYNVPCMSWGNCALILQCNHSV